MCATSGSSDQGLGVTSFLVDPKKITFFQKYRLRNQWKYQKNERIPHVSENITITTFLWGFQTLITRSDLCLWLERHIFLPRRKPCTILARLVWYGVVLGSFGDVLAYEKSHLIQSSHKMNYRWRFIIDYSFASLWCFCDEIMEGKGVVYPCRSETVTDTLTTWQAVITSKC